MRATTCPERSTHDPNKNKRDVSNATMTELHTNQLGLHMFADFSLAGGAPHNVVQLMPAHNRFGDNIFPLNS